ncbi:QRFP-like peptide receptor [Saccoglossus kowalevskii]|uniref:Neuropeptide FF receptor 2-like n=1 Tax=Saccoglossus kowalevskii TaxID=10224 RepID=A0ABM0GJL6_SACKO|nr:PREDICTED: neuropeptide FF receptor 2-like [Saccoglossus kowalevskii]
MNNLITQNGSLLNETTSYSDVIEPTYGYVSESVIYTMYGLCMFLIVSGNLMVIVAVLLEPKLRQAGSNVLIASLAVSDLLVGAYYIPSVIMWNKALSLMVNPIICNIDGFIQLTSTGASVFTLIAIASDRFRAIVTPLKPKITRGQAAIMVVVAWSCAMSYASYVPIAWEYQIYRYQIGNETFEIPYCHHLPQYTLKTFRVIDFFVLFLIPLFVLTGLYAPMVYKLWLEKQPVSSTGYKKKNAVKMLSMVVILFFVMWLPHYTFYLYVNYVDYTRSHANLRAVALFSVCSNFSNSWVNPVIYACFNDSFRNAYKNALLCRLWRKSRKINPASSHNSGRGTRIPNHTIEQPMLSRNTLLTTSTIHTTSGSSFISALPSSHSYIPPAPSFVGQSERLLVPPIKY